MRILTIALVLIMSLFAVQAQEFKNLDSLQNLLSKSREDTNKVTLLLWIADYYEANNQDSSLIYLERSRSLSESLKYTKGLFQYFEQGSIVLFTKGDYNGSMEKSIQALALARELKDSSLVINVLNNIGIIYGYLNKFEEQLNYTLQVKNTIEAIKDSNKLSPIYHNLANCYYNLKQFRRSIEYASLSIRIHKELKKKNNYINRVYATLAQSYDDIQIQDSALIFYNKAIMESQKSQDKYAEATIYGYLTNLYAENYQFDKMLTTAEKCLQMARDLQSRQMEASALYNIAYANFSNGNLAIAKKQITESLEIATKDTLRDELRNAYMVLSYIAANEGDYKTSMWAKIKTDSIQNAIFNDKVINATTELEKKYESEKKDKQIILQQAQLDRRRILNYILIGSALTFLIVALLSYRNYKQKQKLQEQRISELEKEKQLTATEAVLKGEEQERTRLAKDLHDGLGGLLSGIKYSFQNMRGNLIMTQANAQTFERSMDMLDSSIKEMRRVAHNMMPESLVKFGLDTALNDFCGDVNQSGALMVNYQSIGMKEAMIEQTTAITIYRITQELINNTMKHASAKSAIVQVSKTKEIISITVEDDGQGFDPLVLQTAKGMGWSNIQSRVSYLKGKLDVQSEGGKGTSVHIELSV